MYKKIIAFITSTLLCFTLLNSSIVMAAKTTEVASCSGSKEQQKNEEVYQKWTGMSAKQKADVYKSLKGTLDAQAKFIDKLVKYELLTKEEAKMMKDDMFAKFNEMKENDELFPAAPHAGGNKQNKVPSNQEMQKSSANTTDGSNAPNITTTPAPSQTNAPNQ